MKNQHLISKIFFSFLVLTLTACANVRYPDTKINSHGTANNANASKADTKKVQSLKQALLDMPGVTTRDAQRVAHMAVFYPQVLTNKYELTSPPLMHNILVNTGSKPRGLCINWTEDMINQTLRINPRSLDIYWGVANKGSALREHSTLVVTGKNQNFSTGVLLDPWRNSGNLFWSKIGHDSRYKWKNINFYDYNKNR